MNYYRLIDLLSDLPVPWHASHPLLDVSVRSIQYDSRRVTEGDVFVAISGGNTDSHDFIPDAVQKGAVAVFGTRSGLMLPVPYIQVEDSREALAYLAAAFYDHPARKMTVIGVTGRMEKPQLPTWFMKSSTHREESRLVSTVKPLLAVRSSIQVFMSPHLKRRMFNVTGRDGDGGDDACCLETTSHGLAQSLFLDVNTMWR
jgi:UDP-N-acetylmuramoyl-L-alanyl-D-glutamate--2,6-diaminopimelate ligase